MEMQGKAMCEKQTMPQIKAANFDLFATGFALFSMFFGAGNLIFPLLIGKSVGPHWWYAVLGLALTAVIVPFLGLAGMVFFDADCKRFFGRIGALPGFLLLLLLQLILGPFGVIPRLITLMHAIVKPYFSDIPLPMFTLIATLLIFVCSFRRQNLIQVLGVVLTPILLLCLASLFYLGFADRSSFPLVTVSAKESFLEGLLGGYNTMDLIAAFLFATVVLPHFQQEVRGDGCLNSKQALSKKMFFTSLIAAALLLFTYIGLCFISAHHGSAISNSSSEELLGSIAHQLLGRTGGLIAAVAIVTACLTTAITLTMIFADYLQKELCSEKISSMTALIATLAITACFANLGFANIAAFLSPILQICYPGLIVLTLLNILYYFTGFKIIKTPVFLTFLASALFYFFG
ncbi:MAG: branched-chain amino acid transport system II carrier protein [Parachlamydiaceae bacterium]